MKKQNALRPKFRMQGIRMQFPKNSSLWFHKILKPIFPTQLFATNAAKVALININFVTHHLSKILSFSTFLVKETISLFVHSMIYDHYYYFQRNVATLSLIIS